MSTETIEEEAQETKPARSQFQTMKVRWTGYRPMILTSTRSVDPEDPQTMEYTKLRGVKASKRTSNNLEDMKRLEWELAMPFEEGKGIFITSDKIERCIKDGAMRTRNGKAAEAACTVDESEVFVTGVKIPKSLDALYEKDDFKIRQPVRIPPRTGTMSMKLKPLLPTGWQIEFTVTFDTGIIDEETLLQAMIDAGALIGIGGWRPKFGRFKVEKI